MAKLWASPAIRLALVAFVILVGYFYFFDSSTNANKTAKKPVARRFTSTQSSDISPEDYTVHFASLNQPLKNSFKPLVIRNNARGEGGSGVKANAVPAFMAGGDANWSYTGTAEVDGVPTVLIENGTSGEGVFLRQGEKWRDLTIHQITQDTVTLIGSDGEEVLLRLISPAEEEEVKPLTPENPLSGPIGSSATVNGLPAPNAAPGISGMAIESAPAAGTVVAPAAAAPGRAAGGRRGRRNRGATNQASNQEGSN